MTDDFNFDDLSLDFLQTTPPKKLNGGRETAMPTPAPLRTLLPFSEKTPTPVGMRMQNRQSSRSEKKKLAQRIAETDVLVTQYRQLEQEQRELKQSAQAIHTMYESERQQRGEYEQKWQQLQERNVSLDEELVNVRLQRDQLEAQLAQREGPIQFSKLAVQYVRLAQRLNDERTLHWQDQATLKKIAQYCEDQKLHIPQPRSPKKRKTKAEKSVQCVLWDQEMPSIVVTAEHSTQCDRLATCDQSTQHSIPLITVHPPVELPPVPAKETRHQSTQCDCAPTRTQGTQHIGTTTTRGTSTTCFIKQHHVGTSFPERKSLPPFRDMLHELYKWQRIKPISRIIDPPPPPMPATCYRTVGTCTFLCNIQRQIDIIPAPLINTTVKRSDSRPPSRLSCDTNIKCETSIHSPPIVSALNSGTSSSTGNLHLPTFEELWQVFGKMLYGLLQHRDAPKVVASPLPTENPPELQNWMRSLYDNMTQQKQGADQSSQPVFEPPSKSMDGKESVARFFQPLPCRNPTDCGGVKNNSGSIEDSLPTQHNVATSPIHFISSPVREKDVFTTPETLHSFLKPNSNHTDIAYKVHLKSPIKMLNNSLRKEASTMSNNINFLSVAKVKMDKLQKKHKKKRLNNINKKLKHSATAPQMEKSLIVENVRTQIATNERQIQNIETESQSLIDNGKYVLEMNLFGSDSDLEDIVPENPNAENKSEKQCQIENIPSQKIQSSNTIDNDMQLNLDGNVDVELQHPNIEDSPSNRNENLIVNDDEEETQLIIDEDPEGELQHVNAPQIIQSTNIEEQKSSLDGSETPPVSRNFSQPIENQLVFDSVINPLTNIIIDQSQQQHKRGRKRKSELNKIIPCKRSERLRARQLIALNSTSSNISLNNTELDKTTTSTKQISDGHIEQQSKQHSATININGEERNEEEGIEEMNLCFFQERELTLTAEDIQEQPLITTQPDTTKELTANNCDSAAFKRQQDDEFKCFMQEHRKVLKKDIPLAIDDPLPSTPVKITSVDDSPASPVPSANDDEANEQQNTKEIPLELHVQRQSECCALLDRIAEYYCSNSNTAATPCNKRKTDAQKEQMAVQLRQYLESTTVNPEVEAQTLTMSLLAISDDSDLLANTIVECVRHIPRPEVELACAVSDVPPNYVAAQLRRIGFALHQLCKQHPDGERHQKQLLFKIETLLFNCESADKLSLCEALNFTQLYLLTISEGNYMVTQNPARLFVGKCLYYHQLKAIPMIYEVLCCYPTVLPHREERSYDRSDALITVIQHALMCTNYDMDKRQLRTRELLSMLRFVYHYEPFRPNQAEVLQNLLDKLRAGRLTNITYAMAIYCKRLPPAKVANEVVHTKLLPLANEFYPLLLQSDAHDECVAALLACISTIVKPFPLQTDVTVYLAFFARFLNAVERIMVQEAAVQAILRLQRFGYANCYQALQHYKPNSDLTQLQPETQAMLKTFVLRKPLSFWRALRQQ